MSVLHCR